ncbi:MAG TPA: bifunctional diaminohydroxyphosphoribosylaminopyrimidine deaminase/5-amino-6-(5-phosphoribosylamino)uracil reductase RibD [Armatimonadota bacterium]|jgi:diaminohydroxyphosphoribosylaminopyrimidine deaminase/5-amino-6-(5-phosphoribosylamino)uracil reductase
MSITADDLRHLRRTLVLARRAHGRTAPNPMVGAVVVKDGVVLGEGFHPKAGEPHAEIFALRAAGDGARDATIYVSLEPCSHYGKTPPCADAIIHAGIRRVVFASLDPNPLVAGRGLDKLHAAGVAVDNGALTDDEQRLNEAWRHWMRTKQPFVTLKLAASLDGKIATRTGESRWITGDAARRDVHRLRATQDAILTTSATVIADNPALTARIPGGRDPRRVVVDSLARTAPEALVYAAAEHAPLLATAVTDEARLIPYRERGVEILSLPTPDGRVDLPALLTALGARDIQSLMIEAGGKFAAALLHARLVHKVRWYVAPLFIDGREATPVLDGPGSAHLADTPRLRDVTWKQFGDDLRIEGYLTPA